MKMPVTPTRLELELPAYEQSKLLQLQQVFAALCNEVSAVAQREGCWGRVRLHHLVYSDLRAAHPHVGAQHICNAVYAVSKAFRVLLSRSNLTTESPGRHSSRTKVIPMIHFVETNPVYFDRKSMSAGPDSLSILGVGGRIKIPMAIPTGFLNTFQHEGIKEITLIKYPKGSFFIEIWTNGDVQRPAMVDGHQLEKAKT